jgi:hypothetical protein
VQELYGAFDGDACAEYVNTVAPRYIDAELDALAGGSWSHGYRTAWDAFPDYQHIGQMQPQHWWLNSPWAPMGVSKAARDAFPDAALAPFPGTAAFAWEAVRQFKEYGTRVTCIMPNAADTKWQSAILNEAAQVLVCRRFPFMDHNGVLQKSPPGGTVIAHFSRHRFKQKVIWGWKP